MKSIDDLAAILPRRRDDEPPELRAQIVKELQDHLECAYQRELLRTGDEVRAAQRVQEQFGDARQLARKLWFEAMQEKIMSQRILIGLSVSLAIACLATGGFALRIAQQTAEASAAATKALVDQGQETNQALLQALDRLVPRPDVAKPAASEKLETSGEFRVKLVKGLPGGAPAADYEINIDGGDFIGVSNAMGEYVVEKTRAGEHAVDVTAPWGETATFLLHSGNGTATQEIVCPDAPLAEFDVALEVQWPDDLRGEHLGLLVNWSKTRKIAGTEWTPAAQPDDQGDNAIVTTDGMMLRNIAGSGEIGQVQNLPLIAFPVAHANPRTTIRWRGTEFRLSVIGIAIPKGYEGGMYHLVRIERDPTDDVDAAVIHGHLTTDRGDQHISLPIPPETAANVRRAIGRTFDPTVSPRDNSQPETPEEKPDPAAIDEQIKELTDAIRKTPPSSIRLLIQRSGLWRKKGDFTKAIEDISEAIRLNPRDPDHYVDRSSLWHEINDVDKELDDLAAVINLKPEEKSAYERRAKIWEKKGEFQKAIKEITKLIQSQSYRDDDADLYMARGHLSQKMHSPANALLDYIEALSRAPKSADTHSNLAWFFATAADPKFRNPKRSLKLATEACRLPGWRNWKALNALAAAHAETGDFALAVAWQAKALEMNGKVFREIPDAEIKSAESRLEVYKAGKPWRDSE
jgi:tetratricopeptide (TPR) repeat protein